MKPRNISFDQIIALMKESFSFVKLYKVLIIFGIIFVMFGGSVSGINSNSLNFNQNYNNINQYGDSSSKSNEYKSSVGEVVEFAQENVIIIVPVVCFIVLVCIVLSTYLRNVSHNVLIGAVDLIDKKQEMSFKSLWKYGHSYALKTFVLEIIYSVASFALILFSIPLILFCGLGIITILVGSISLAILLDLSKRYLLLKDKSIVDSIKEAFELFKNNIANFALYWISLVVISLGLGIFSVTLGFLLIFVLVIIVFGLLIFAVGSIWAVLVSVGVIILAIIVISIIIALIKGPVIAIVETWKTKYWKLIVSEM